MKERKKAWNIPSSEPREHKLESEVTDDMKRMPKEKGTEKERFTEGKRDMGHMRKDKGC